VTATPDNSVLLASHRFGWKSTEIVPMILLPIISVAFAWHAFGGFLLGNVRWWVIAIVGPGLSILIFVVGGARKRGSALELREEAGTWRLYRGGHHDSRGGSSIRKEEITDVRVVVDEYTDAKSLMLATVDSRGLTVASLQIPSRLLVGDSLLKEQLGSLAGAEKSDVKSLLSLGPAH